MVENNVQSEDALSTVRIDHVREMTNAVVLQTCSEEERNLLLSSATMNEAGPKVQRPAPKPMRLMIRSVPKHISTDMLLEEIHARNFGRLIEAAQFKAEFRVCSRNTDAETGNVVAEMLKELYETLVQQRKAYVGFETYGITNLSGVPTCFRCRSQTHLARDCQQTERCCYRCGEPGHMLATCASKPKCRNFQNRNLPHEHAAASTACPIYKSAMERINNHVQE